MTSGEPPRCGNADFSCPSERGDQKRGLPARSDSCITEHKGVFEYTCRTTTMKSKTILVSLIVGACFLSQQALAQGRTDKS